jgi:hypothetical protein
MDGNIAIIEHEQKCWVHQELLKATNWVWRIKSRLRGSPATRAPTLEPATSKSNSKPHGCCATRYRHGGQALQLEKQAKCGSANMSTRRQATDLKGSKPTAVIANIGARLWQATGPYFSTARREQANSSHGQPGR